MNLQQIIDTWLYVFPNSSSRPPFVAWAKQTYAATITLNGLLQF